jgi:hypothetical protein
MKLYIASEECFATGQLSTYNAPTVATITPASATEGSDVVLTLH